MTRRSDQVPLLRKANPTLAVPARLLLATSVRHLPRWRYCSETAVPLGTYERRHDSTSRTPRFTFDADRRHDGTPETY